MKYDFGEIVQNQGLCKTAKKAVSSLHFILVVENSVYFFHTMGEDLFKPSSFLASSKKEEATKRDPVVLLLHDLMLNAHANSNITRTQTLCPGLSGLNRPSGLTDL